MREVVVVRMRDDDSINNRNLRQLARRRGVALRPEERERRAARFKDGVEEDAEPGRELGEGAGVAEPGGAEGGGGRGAGGEEGWRGGGDGGGRGAGPGGFAGEAGGEEGGAELEGGHGVAEGGVGVAESEAVAVLVEDVVGGGVGGGVGEGEFGDGAGWRRRRCWGGHGGEEPAAVVVVESESSREVGSDGECHATGEGDDGTRLVRSGLYRDGNRRS